MKAIKFKEHNVVFAENQPEYENLPALKFNNKEGDVISCWKLNWKERFRVFFIGKIWNCQLTFNKPYAPTLLTTKKNELFIITKKSNL